MVREHISKIRLYGTYKCKEVIFRGQEYFRGNVWRDWVLIDWGRDGKLPGKLWGFTDLRKLPANCHLNYGAIRLQPGIYAVIETAFFSVDEERVARSEIFVPIIKEVSLIANGQVQKLKFFLADVEAFLKPLVVIPDIGGDINAYFLVKDRETWRQDFISFLLSDLDLEDVITKEPSIA